MAEYFFKVGTRDCQTTLGLPGKSVGAPSIQIASPTGWPVDSKVAFSIFSIDPATEEEVPNTYTEWIGTLSGSSIDGIELTYGNDQPYAPGDNTIVVIHISTTWANRLVEGIRKFFNDDATAKEGVIPTAALVNGAVTTDKIANDAVIPAKIPDASIPGLKLVDGSLPASKIDYATFTDDIFPVINANTSNNNINSAADYSQYTYTVSVAGVYFMSFSQRMVNGTSNNDLQIKIMKNDVMFSTVSTGGSTWVNYIAPTATGAIRCSAGDVLKCTSRGGGSGSYTVSGGRVSIARIA